MLIFMEMSAKCSKCTNCNETNLQISMFWRNKNTCKIRSCMVKYIGLICVEARGCRKKWRFYGEFSRSMSVWSGEYEIQAPSLIMRSGVLPSVPEGRVADADANDFGFLNGRKRNARRGVGYSSCPLKRSSRRIANMVSTSQSRYASRRILK